jgi:hypothetical protein
MPDLEKIVREHFGVTADLRETGYILSDGTFVDLSGRHHAVGYQLKDGHYIPKRGQPDYLRGQRSTDHRELPTAVRSKFRRDEDMGSGTYPMYMFIKTTGAIRVMPGVGISVAARPTVEALAYFLVGWKRAYGSDSIVVDVLDVDRNAVHTKKSEEIKNPTLEKLMEFIESGIESGWSMGAGWKDRFKKSPMDWSPSGEIPGMPIWPEFVDGYLEAALFSSNDEAGIPLDKTFSLKNFSQEAVDKAVRDSNAFIEENRKDLEAASQDKWEHGRDFWFTRNRHGVGFWSNDYEEEIGERLTESAHKYGERHVDVGPDQQLYIYG